MFWNAEKKQPEPQVRFTILNILGLVIGYLSLIFLQLDSFADDPGVGWHLQTGAWIMHHHAVPLVDPFLFSRVPQPWVAYQWLADLLIYSLYQLSSWPGIYGACVALFLWGFFGKLSKTLWRDNAGQVSALAIFIAVILAFKVSLVHFILRPVVFSIVGFILLYAELGDLIRFESEAQVAAANNKGLRRTQRNRLLRIFLLFAVWANLHPEFVLGWLLLGIFVAAESIKLLRGQLPRRAWLFAVTLGIAALAATCFNPYGLALHESIFGHAVVRALVDGLLGISIPGGEALHEEWLGLNLASLEGQVFVVMLLGIGAGLIACRERKWRYSMYEILSTLVFACAAYKSVRFLPYFGVVAALPLARGLTCFGERMRERFAGPLQSVGVWLAGRRASSLGAGSKPIEVFICGAIALLAIAGGWLPGFKGEFGPSRASFPYAAVQYLLSERGAVDENSPLVVAAPPAWGGFLIWQGRERILPIVDDRSDRSTQVGGVNYGEYLNFLNGATGWSEYFEKIGADFLLLPVRARLAAEVQQHTSKRVEWQLVEQGAVASLFRRIR